MQVAYWLTPKKDKPLPVAIYDQNLPHLRISYCTTCMGRLHHLKKTYLKNIEDNLAYENIEFVLVNYNSKDHLDKWARKYLRKYISSGKVQYYHTTDPENFHMSKAKNLSHRLASGDILVNLDADNYLGKDNAFYLNYLYQQSGNSNKVISFTKSDFRFYDTCGRIAVKANSFYRVRGYREDLLPYGGEDFDFIHRLSLIENYLLRVEYVNFLRTVKHDTVSRGSNLGSSMSVKEMRQKNQEMAVNLPQGIEANPRGFEKYKVVKNFKEIILLDSGYSPTNPLKEHMEVPVESLIPDLIKP